MSDDACSPPARALTIGHAPRAVLAWGHLKRSVTSLPSVGTWFIIERFRSRDITGIYHGINPYTWSLQFLTESQCAAGGKPMSIAFKDIARMLIADTSTLWGSQPRNWRVAAKTMASIRRFFFNQQLRRLLQSQLSSLLRTALAIPATRDLEFGFEGVCSDLEIDDAKIRLRELASRDQARDPPIDLCCQNWVCVFQSLTEFDQILLKATCLYFNALEYPASDGRANPERKLFRKAAYHVLDPGQNVDDLFWDTNADVDEFRLMEGTPAVCISALHLAARTGDSSMCEVLLKRQADVNVNVLLLPVPDVDGSEYELCSPDVEGLPEALSLEMNTIPTSTCKSGDGYGYDVDFGHVTPLRLAQHFGHTAVETLLRQRSGHNGHSPEEHYATNGKRRKYDAPNIARRCGIPYVGIYERPLRRGTCVGSCLFYSQPRRAALASLGGDPDVDSRGADGESDSDEVESDVSDRGPHWGRDWATSGMIGSDRDFDSDAWYDSD